MSAPKYQYGHGTAKRRPRKALLILSSSLLVIALIGAVIYLDLSQSTSPTIEGENRVVRQVLNDSSQRLVVDDSLFTLELPGDWKETSRNENSLYTSITWQATAKNKDNRTLTLYVDKIPFNMPFNRIVTVKAQGSGLGFANVSDDCANFTVGGTDDNRITHGKPTPTKWNKVDFICNLPRAIDNQVGTGSEAMPNGVTVTGPTQGAHTYFFLYTDHNVQPDYNILYETLQSFRAK